MLEDPNIDYAKVAQGLGLHGEGPITDPKDLGPALRRAIATVQAGEPALVDVVINRDVYSSGTSNQTMYK